MNYYGLLDHLEIHSMQIFLLCATIMMFLCPLETTRKVAAWANELHITDFTILLRPSVKRSLVKEAHEEKGSLMFGPLDIEYLINSKANFEGSLL